MKNLEITGNDFLELLDVLIKLDEDKELGDDYASWFLTLWSENNYTKKDFEMIRSHVEKNHKGKTISLLKTGNRKCVTKNWIERQEKLIK